jgi:uncharacterized RDD family membrane protein YckC
MNRLADKFAPAAALAFTVLCVAFCTFCGSTARAAELLAQANDQTVWIAQVNQTPPVRTTIRYRAVGGDLQWRELPRLAGKVIDMASRGSSLAVLMDTGEWLLVWPNGYSTGPALPRGAKMIAIASQQDALYAIGITGGARALSAQSTATTTSKSAPATTPTTSESPATTEPSISGPPPEKLALFKFDGSAWNQVAELPDDIPPTTADPSLAVIDGQPIFAISGPDQTIRVVGLNSDKQWVESGTISPGFTVRQFKLLGVSQSPLLWVAGNSDAGVIYTRRQQQWNGPTKLELEKPILPPRARAFTFAAGNLRLFVEDDAGRLFEQAYQVDGTRVGNFAPMAAPRPTVPPGYNNWLILSALTAALFVMLSSTRKREAGEDPKIGGFPLAPPALRLLAGLTDLLPIFLTAGTIIYRDNIEITELPPIPMLVAAGVYLAHTLIGELAMGRSIGKIIVGLRVLSVSGNPAGAGAIVVRNLFRTIDWFPPVLVLILFTPLRQRLGDMLGGTVVVSTSPVEEEPDREEE